MNHEHLQTRLGRYIWGEGPSSINCPLLVSVNAIMRVYLLEMKREEWIFQFLCHPSSQSPSPKNICGGGRLSDATPECLGFRRGEVSHNGALDCLGRLLGRQAPSFIMILNEVNKIRVDWKILESLAKVPLLETDGIHCTLEHYRLHVPVAPTLHVFK
jgi:hypothetical protein